MHGIALCLSENSLTRCPRIQLLLGSPFHFDYVLVNELNTLDVVMAFSSSGKSYDVETVTSPILSAGK